MHVSVLSIIFMTLSALISIGVPVHLFLFFRKRYDAKIFPMILGAAAFIIFALILESSIHRIVFNNFPLREMPAPYIVYGIFMAGIFEETARFIAFHILKRKYSKQRTEASELAHDNFGTGLAYGIGHGGIESVLLAGVSMILAIFASILVNTGNIEIITSRLQGEVLVAINGQIEALAVTSPFMFLISGIERLMAISIQLSLSVMVYYAVFGKRKIWLYPLAILSHAIVDIPAAAFQVGVLKSIAMVEGIIFLSAILLIILVRFLHKKNCCEISVPVQIP